MGQFFSILAILLGIYVAVGFFMADGYKVNWMWGPEVVKSLYAKFRK